MISGKTLIEWGYKPAPWFSQAIIIANELRTNGVDQDTIRSKIDELVPPPQPIMSYRTNSIPFGLFLDAETEDEKANLAGVVEHMDVLLRTPTIVSGAVMPDACPSGSAPGTIPVGGVVATKNAIHPGFHSADVCCSMAISVFKRDMPVKTVLDIAMKTTHFGPGINPHKTRKNNSELQALLAKFDNPFLKDLERYAIDLLMTQGDGNHFFYVGHLESTGQLVIVTHHGSRGLGAQIYKRGMAAAQRHTAIVSPRTPSHNAWIEADTETGRNYWEALQVARAWTKLNHFAIHDAMSRAMGNAVVDRFWNEHNFVFQRSDGLFYHGKGATPSFRGFSADDAGLTLIPLNMGAPILIAEPTDRTEALGFAPHGAGRNLSRGEHIRRLEAEFGSDRRGLSDRHKLAVFEREITSKNVDARFYCGHTDVSELPSAYKNAASMREQISQHDLARIVDTIIPGGSIMAGDLKPEWRGKKAR